MAEKKARNSNLEILRIVSMLLIILAHYAGHGGIIDQATAAGGHFLGLCLKTGGKLGVVCFVLISTYFMCEQKFKFEALLKTLLQATFYALLVFVILLLSGQSVGMGTAVKSLFAVFLGNYWFVAAYLGMYLFQPLLKKITDSLDMEKSMTVTVMMALVFTVIPFAFGNVTFVTSNLAYFCFLFFVGNHLRKYPVRPKLLDSFPLVVCLISAALIPVSAFVIEQVLKGHPDAAARYHFIFYDLNSPLMLLAGIGLFLCFVRRKPTVQPLINKFAANMFGVYLLHDNIYVRHFLWHKLLRIDSVYDKNVLVILGHALLCSAVIMVCASLVETVRRIPEKWLMQTVPVKKLCAYCNARYSEI